MYTVYIKSISEILTVILFVSPLHFFRYKTVFPSYIERIACTKMFASTTVHITLLINTAFFGHNALDPSAAHRFPAIYVRAYYCFTTSLFMVVVCGTAVVLVRVRETCQNTSSSSLLAGNVGPRCCSFPISPSP